MITIKRDGLTVSCGSISLHCQVMHQSLALIDGNPGSLSVSPRNENIEKPEIKRNQHGKNKVWFFKSDL